MKEYNIGVSSNCECGKDNFEILDNIKKAGFKSVMIAEKNGDFEKTIAYALSIGLEIPYVHLSHDFANNLWVKGGTNEIFIEKTIESLEICAKFNIKIVVFHGTAGNAGTIALPPNKQGIDSMNKLLKRAEELDIKIALENLDAPNKENFFYLLDNISSPSLGFCYDIGHHYLYFPEIDLIKKYGDRLIALHTHDNLMSWSFGQDWTKDFHLLPFDGKINWEKVAEDLALTKYDAVLLLELHKNLSDCGLDVYDKLSNLEYLTKAYENGKKLAELIEKKRKEKNR